MSASRCVHSAAVRGYDDSASASLYATARPGYSDEAITRILHETRMLHSNGWGLRRGTTVLDLGAGTGKMTWVLIYGMFDSCTTTSLQKL